MNAADDIAKHACAVGKIAPHHWIIGCPGILKPVQSVRVCTCEDVDGAVATIKGRMMFDADELERLDDVEAWIKQAFVNGLAQAVDLVPFSDRRLFTTVGNARQVEHFTIDLDDERTPGTTAEIFMGGKKVADATNVKVKPALTKRSVEIRSYGPIMPHTPNSRTTIAMRKGARIVDVYVQRFAGNPPTIDLVAVEETDTTGEERRTFAVLRNGDKIEFDPLQSTPCAYIGKVAAPDLDYSGDPPTGALPTTFFVFEIFDPQP